MTSRTPATTSASPEHMAGAAGTVLAESVGGLLTSVEVARIIRVPHATLRYWRHIGIGPKSFKMGPRRVLYREDDMRAWVAKHDAAGCLDLGQHRQAVGWGVAGKVPRLRHYYASLLIRHGESVKTVQARLGHASASETLDTYSHLWPDSDERTRDAVDLVLQPAADYLRTSAETGTQKGRSEA